MRSSVRESERHLLVGIDVAKSNHHAFPSLPEIVLVIYFSVTYCSYV